MLVAVGVLWLVAAVVVIAVALWFRMRFDRLMREQIEPAAKEIRDAVRKIEALVDDARRTVGRIDSVAAVAENIAKGEALAAAAAKIVAGSKVSLMSTIAGIREGLRALRKSSESKEVAERGGQ